MGWPVINLKLELGPLSIKEWDTGEKHGKIGPYLAELVFWISCKMAENLLENGRNPLLEKGRNTVVGKRPKHLEL